MAKSFRGMQTILQQAFNGLHVAIFSILILLLPGCTTPGGRTEAPMIASQLRFNIQLAPQAETGVAELGLDTPINGRVFVVISRTDDEEPRLLTDVSGVPFWGRNISDFKAGTTVQLDLGSTDVRGYPLQTVADLPAGEYFVQPFLSVYTTFNRADGHTVSMHLNSGAGQNQWRAPGNVYGETVKFLFNPGQDTDVALTLDTVIPPEEPLADGDVLQQGNPRDTDWVKYVKIQSDVLSQFWGRPMYIGANVLLPEGYDAASDLSMPVMYMQGHFPGRRAPLGFNPGEPGRGRSEGFADYWTSGQAPKMIAITIRDANPYYDTSYSVNSENVGPYGDAITTELIPYLEDHFRIIPESWARVVAGGSTGGWEALAMQVFYPDYFGGAWGQCPDPVDFNYYQIVNIYEDENAYFLGDEWHQVERPSARAPDGNVRFTVRQENYMELATGPNSRSGGQWAIWEAVFGPVGQDGYPRPIWDPVSGVIDHETAEYWRSNYDINAYLKSNWESIGPKIDGKIHIAVGDMDSYYLDNAVYLLDEFLAGATAPRIDYSVQYGRRKPHCWTGESPSRPGEDMSTIEFVQIVADYLEKNAPTTADMRWLRR